MNELFEGSHYHLIRTCPEYRMACMLEDMRLELEPAWATPPVNNGIEDRLNELEAEVSKPGSIPRRYSDELNQVKGQVIHLRNKIAELSDKKEPDKRKTYTIK
ncbi:hypothetical protein LCGC14_1734180 [marine sediment metagenome]|uniref:Uncharacterized protein n=1 Tax=marine sediment metagenome TaxID=412755 RepID=A0A0F9HWC9_9ZZZZ